MNISAHNLSKKYNRGIKRVVALDDVSLNIRSGESTAVIGPSGAGKSTLLHLLGGLDTPTRGRVILGDVDIYKLSEAKRAAVRNRKVGFVFQFYHLLSEFTAIENVMLPAMISGFRAKEKARDILKMVGLEHRMAHKPGELSGGEAQRVAIARALINEPEILLCDEPTGNLDSKTAVSIYELLFGLNSKRRMTLVIVTHDEKLSSKAVSSIHLKDGRIFTS